MSDPSGLHAAEGASLHVSLLLAIMGDNDAFLFRVPLPPRLIFERFQ